MKATHSSLTVKTGRQTRALTGYQSTWPNSGVGVGGVTSDIGFNVVCVACLQSSMDSITSKF